MEKGADKAQVNPAYQLLPRTEFIGRETLEAPATITGIMHPTGPQPVEFRAEIALDRTPFYAEAGGQVGDTGVFLSPETNEPVAIVEIRALRRARQERPTRIKFVGPMAKGLRIIAKVDEHARHSTMRNHTGTHLLHALRTVLRERT